MRKGEEAVARAGRRRQGEGGRAREAAAKVVLHVDGEEVGRLDGVTEGQGIEGAKT